MAKPQGEEDGNHPTRPIRVPLVRQGELKRLDAPSRTLIPERRQANRRRHLELQALQEDLRWRSLHLRNPIRRYRPIDHQASARGR